MRALRIAAPVQLSLISTEQAGIWAGLPDSARAEALALLARLIARGVLACPEVEQ